MYGEDGLKKSMSKNKYTAEFKLSVLKYRIYHSLTYTETAEHFNIKNAATIANWTKIYEQKGFEGLLYTIGRPKERPNMPKPKNVDIPDKNKKLSKTEREELLELRQKTKYLEAENIYLKKLEALIQEKRSRTKKKQK